MLPKDSLLSFAHEPLVALNGEVVGHADDTNFPFPFKCL